MCSRIKLVFTECLQLEEEELDGLSLSEDDEDDIDSEIFNPEKIVGTKMFGKNYSATLTMNNNLGRTSQHHLKKTIDENIIDQVVASMDDIAKMKMVQELTKIRRRVSIVPDTNTIVEDQFLEPMAQETGIEADKGADMLTRNDRKRMVRRISLRLASNINNEIERKKSSSSYESNSTGFDSKLPIEARTSISKKIHNSRKIKHKRHIKTSVDSVPESTESNQTDLTKTMKKSFTNMISNFLTEDNNNINDFACKSGFSISQRSSNSFISDEIEPNTKPRPDQLILKADQRYDKRLERYRRNTLNSLHRGSLGAAEQSQGLIVEGSDGPKNTSSALSFISMQSEISHLDRRTSQQLNLIKKQSEITMNKKEDYTRRMSISTRDVSARPKLVSNDENVSSYPLPGTDYSTKMGGTWRTTQNAKNLLSEKEITDILNKTILDEVKSKNKENK